MDTVRITLRTLVGTLVCAATAGLLTLLLRDGATIRLAAPAICIQVVVVTALFLGRTAAFIGAILAGITFALWLYPPYGHLWIHDPGERIMLTLFEVFALCVALIAPPRPSRAAVYSRSSSPGLHSLRLYVRRRSRLKAADTASQDRVPPSLT